MQMQVPANQSITDVNSWQKNPQELAQNHLRINRFKPYCPEVF